MNVLPNATRPLVEFPSALRANGFAVSPDQTMGFIEGVGLLGPRSIEDVRSAAIAMMAIPKEREEEFDTIFRAFFFGETATGMFEDEEQDVEAHEATGSTRVEPQEPDEEKPGEEAASFERLARRDFDKRTMDEALRKFGRLAPARLPRRRSYRYASDRRGRSLDIRRTLRIAARQDGEIFELEYRKRRSRQRRIVLLMDVSGSMADRTDDYQRFAHTLSGASERLEVFTLGTRLTRVSQAFRRKNVDQALARVSALVADIDGGTRIGEALQSFLAVPRYVGFARGALVIILSDGLERGGPEAMIDAVKRLSRIAWRVDWISPLAIDGKDPETAAMSAVRPYLSDLTDGTDITKFTDHLLNLESVR